MRTSIIATLIALTVSPLSAQIKSSIAGVQIINTTYGKTDYGADLKPFNAFDTGSNIAILLESPSTQIISFEQKNASLSTFSDSTGKSLFQKKKSFSGQNFGLNFPTISKDKKALIFTLTTDELPAKGASHINIKGEVEIATGSKTKTETSAAVKLTKGDTFKIGDFTFEISNIEKPTFGDAVVSIELKTHQDIVDIAAFRFKNAEGKELKHSIGGSSSFSGFGQSTFTKSFQLFEKPGSFILELDVYTDRKIEKLPINFKASLGN